MVLGTLLLFLGGRFYQSMLLCLAFMLMSGAYMFQFNLRHYFYLQLISLLIAGFLLNRIIRISFILLRRWKTVWNLCFHRKNKLVIHCAILFCLFICAFALLFVANLIQTRQVRTEIENLDSAKKEAVQFQTKEVQSNILRGISATELSLANLYNDVLDQNDPRQLIFNEFLKVKVKVINADPKEKITVFAKYENTAEYAFLPLHVGDIIFSTWTCPIPLTLTIGHEMNVLYLPIYFSRNRSPLIGIELVAGGKKIEIKSVDRIIETDKIRTQSAFLVPNQKSKMQYAGRLNWSKIFWGEKDRLPLF